VRHKEKTRLRANAADQRERDAWNKKDKSSIKPSIKSELPASDGTRSGNSAPIINTVNNTPVTNVTNNNVSGGSGDSIPSPPSIMPGNSSRYNTVR